MNKTHITREQYKFIKEYPTRWGDMDGLRHLNHTVYLTLMETARVDLYAELGLSISKWDVKQSSILASMKIDYIEQVHHPETLEIGQRIIRVGRTSYDLLTGIFKKDSVNPVAQAVFTLVSFDYALNKPVPIPAILNKKLEPID